MNNLLDIFKSKIVQVEKKLPKGHPIMTYREENDAIKSVIKEMKEEAIKNNQERFIKNRWLELYDKIYEFNKHLARKQHQLFSLLEKKGFDRPSRIMWSFDNAVRDSISQARRLLDEGKIEEFMNQQEKVWELTIDIMDKEEQILYPTSLELITEEEFRNKYPWNWTDHLMPQLKKRYTNLKFDQKFNRLKSKLTKDEKLSKERRSFMKILFSSQIIFIKN